MIVAKITYNGSVINSSATTSPCAVTYRGRQITTVSTGNTKTLKCAGKLMGSDITVGNRVIKINNKIALTDIKVTVADEKLTVNIPTVSGTYTYNGNQQTVSINGYDSVSMDQSGTLSATNAGTYTITYSLKNTTDSQWADGTTTNKTVSWTIGRQKIDTIPTVSGTYTYDKAAHTPTITGFIDGVMTKSGDYGEKTNAGTYTISFTPTSNYCWSDGSTGAKSGTWKINKKTLTKPSLSSSDGKTSWEYDGNTHSVTINNFNNSWETQTPSTFTTSSSQVGSWTVTWTLDDTTNTAWSDNSTSAISATWSITPKQISVSASNGSADYNGSVQTAGASVSVTSPSSGYTLVFGKDTSYGYSSLSAAATAAGCKNAGTYTIYYKATATNYSDKTGSISITINKKSITQPSVSSPSPNTYTGSTLSAVISGGTGSSWYTQGGTASATNAGTYTVTFTLTDTTNTKWASGSTGSGTWSIAPKSVTVPTATNTSYTYDGNQHNPTINNPDSSYINQSGTIESINAGSWTITWTLKDTTNTAWSSGGTGSKTASWSIAKATRTMSFNPTSLDFGTGTDTTDLSFTVSVSAGSGELGTISVTADGNFKGGTISGTTVHITHNTNETATKNPTIKMADTTNYTTTSKTIQCKSTKSGSSCVSSDTMILMGDGTEKMIKDVKRGESIMTYNMDTGKFESQSAIIYWDEHKIISPICLHLNFNDGTLIRLIWEHGFFDKTLNTYSYINYNNYNEFIGHDFVAYDKDGYKLLKLVSAELVNEQVEQYSMESAYNDNFITNGLISMTQEPAVGRFEYFKFSDNVTWDQEDKQAMIDKYGLYTYDEWKEYIPDEEMFNAVNGPYFKILMGKGIITMDDIWYMLEELADGTKD